MNKEEIFKYINGCLQDGLYTKLPDTIAINTVYKIPYSGSLTDDGYEIGFLYIPVGSGIKEHTHINDVERYLCVQGDLRVKGESCNNNICLLDQSHDITEVTYDTIIQTCKVSKFALGDKVIDNDFFEEIISRDMESKKAY